MYTFRPATKADFDWAYDLFKRLNYDFVRDLAGEWPEPFQTAFFAKGFSDPNMSIIEYNGKPVGMSCISEDSSRVHISHVHIEPGYQGRGLGLEILERALEKAQAVRKPLETEALTTNEYAVELYQRHGFKIYGATEYEWVREHRFRHQDTERYLPQPAPVFRNDPAP